MKKPEYLPAETPLLGWHFLQENYKVARPDAHAYAGLMQEELDNVAICCKSGFHNSKYIVDAASYENRFGLVQRCALSGQLDHEADKSCGQRRATFWIADITHEANVFVLHVTKKCLKKYGSELDPSLVERIDILMDQFRIAPPEKYNDIIREWSGSNIPSCHRAADDFAQQTYHYKEQVTELLRNYIAINRINAIFSRRGPLRGLMEALDWYTDDMPYKNRRLAKYAFSRQLEELVICNHAPAMVSL